MFSKFELVGASISVGLMAFAIYLVQVDAIWSRDADINQTSQVHSSQQSGIVIVGQSANVNQARTDALLSAVDNDGNLNSMVIDDVKFGTGETVKDGDTVSVHYVGTLQNGEEFDNSRKRGAAFDFKVGAGMVIKGWDEGVVGMQVGGQRILVIPPEMAYGNKGVGPIPGGATLVFAIELLEVK